MEEKKHITSEKDSKKKKEAKQWFWLFIFTKKGH